MSRAWAGGSSRRWRATRRVVLARDRGACRLKLPGVCTGRATHVHHLHGRGRCTGCSLDVVDHLVAACERCNLTLGDPGRRRAAPQAKPRTKW